MPVCSSIPGTVPAVIGNHSQPPQFAPGPLQISPVGPSLQATYEPSSVQYYLQQDLEALRRVSQQNTPPSLGQQSNPNSGQQLLLATHSTGGRGMNRHQRNMRNSRRLSLDPHTRLKVEKLEVVGLLSNILQYAVRSSL